MRNIVIGYIWGGERQTAEHRVIAEIRWPLPTGDLARGVDVVAARGRARDFTEERAMSILDWPSLDDYATHGVMPDYPWRTIPINVSVKEWDVLPEWWEIVYFDANGDAHRMKESH